MIESLDHLKASVSYFASSCANKLRGQGSVTKAVTVFVCSNFFREDLPQYYNAATWKFQVGTADTLEITCAALNLLKAIYRPGIKYKKSGVVLSDISSDTAVQQILFDGITNRQERLTLSRSIDMLNQKYGLKTVGLAVERTHDEPWKVRCEHRSGNYLTELSDILTVQI